MHVPVYIAAPGCAVPSDTAVRKTPPQFMLKVTFYRHVRTLMPWPSVGGNFSVASLCAAVEKLFSLTTSEASELMLWYKDDKGDRCTLTDVTLDDALILATRSNFVIRIFCGFGRASQHLSLDTDGCDSVDVAEEVPLTPPSCTDVADQTLMVYRKRGSDDTDQVEDELEGIQLLPAQTEQLRIVQQNVASYDQEQFRSFGGSCVDHSDIMRSMVPMEETPLSPVEEVRFVPSSQHQEAFHEVGEVHATINTHLAKLQGRGAQDVEEKRSTTRGATSISIDTHQRFSHGIGVMHGMAAEVYSLAKQSSHELSMPLQGVFGRGFRHITKIVFK